MLNKSNKIFLTLLLVCITSSPFAQNNAAIKLNVSIIKNTKDQRPLRYADSLTIQFDGGFINDIVEVKTGHLAFRTKPLTTDSFFAHAGSLSIPKIKGRQRLLLYFNDSLVGKIVLKKRFSAAHITKYSRTLFWTYINFFFIYL